MNKKLSESEMHFYFSVPDLSKKYMKIRLNYLSDSRLPFTEKLQHKMD